jgi:hypothetical protein
MHFEMKEVQGIHETESEPTGGDRKGLYRLQKMRGDLPEFCP